MKHYFFVNPVAGKGNQSNELIEDIRTAMQGSESEYEIILTEPNRKSEARARDIAEGLNGEAARFYACGGDGTANEIASGVIGFDGVELGIVPIGSGNDMIRNFPDAGNFMNVRSQINGESREVDVMKFMSIVGGEEQTGYCLNMFNIGFDCNVVETALNLKKKKFFSGAAYQTAIFLNFVKKRAPVSIFTRTASKSEKAKCFYVLYQMDLIVEEELSRHHRRWLMTATLILI